MELRKKQIVDDLLKNDTLTSPEAIQIKMKISLQETASDGKT